jgi:hypothetical protein
MIYPIILVSMDKMITAMVIRRARTTNPLTRDVFTAILISFKPKDGLASVIDIPYG